MRKIGKIFAVVLALALVLSTCFALAACNDGESGGGKAELTITVTSQNLARGSITFDKEKYASGEEVTVTLKPKSNYVLDQLIVNNQDVTESVVNNVYKFTITSNSTVEIFYKKKGTVKLTVGEISQIRGSITLSPQRTNNEYNKDDEVTATIVANDGYRIASVMLGDTDVTDELSNGQYSFVMDKNYSLIVSIVPTDAYVVTVNGLTEANGEAQFSGESENGFGKGEQTTLTLTAKKGYLIGSVSVDGVDKTAYFGNYVGTYDFVMNDNHEVTVTFVEDMLTEILDVTAAEFSEAISRYETVVVYFWATWCGPCTTSKPYVQEFAEMDNGVKVIKVDYGTAPSSADDQTEEHKLFYYYNSYYGNNSIPMLVLFKDGSHVAGMTPPGIYLTVDNLVDLVTNPDNYGPKK